MLTLHKSNNGQGQRKQQPNLSISTMKHLYCMCDERLPLFNWNIHHSVCGPPLERHLKVTFIKKLHSNIKSKGLRNAKKYKLSLYEVGKLNMHNWPCIYTRHIILGSLWLVDKTFGKEYVDGSQRNYYKLKKKFFV